MLYFCLIRTVPQSIAVTLRGKKGAEVLLRCVKGKAGKVVMRNQKARRDQLLQGTLGNCSLESRAAMLALKDALEIQGDWQNISTHCQDGSEYGTIECFNSCYATTAFIFTHPN